MSVHVPNGSNPPKPGSGTARSTQRQLINLAYRLLGSRADAEDVVQDAYARFFAMPQQQQDAIESPGAWLSTVTSRLCLNLLGSARARRELYVGEWIPEPLPESTGWNDGPMGAVTVDPADRITLDESINMAFLVVLESMTPAERVAFILHDVFCYSFTEVADIVGRSPGACRQLASSARRRVRAARTPATPTAQQADIVKQFKRALEDGDVDALVGLLAPNVTAVGDGGGLVSTVLHPVVGAERIARALVQFDERLQHLTLLEHMVNGQPGLVAQQDGVTVSVYSFEITDDLITHIWGIRNPQKLHRWRQESLGE
jgi:RNA polymerase sigma-70 factor (ECF subfamily)